MTTADTTIAAPTEAAVRAGAVAGLAALRAKAPLVHNITNYVAMDISANVLLAIGASPAMVHAIEEVEEFVSFSSALVVNIGTLSPSWIDAMVKAARRARERSIPWVLDPVGAGATALRNEAVARLIAEKPTLIRGNASEILAVAGAAAAGKGVDSGNSSDEARAPAIALARATGAVVIVSGAVDVITDGQRVAALANGDALMTRVTAVGCALSAVVAGFAAAVKDPFEAGVAATAVYGVAGELAAATAAGGPATFRSNFLDLLARLDGDTVARTLRVVA
jgi:hydroxyethylthiazole kinase